MKTQKHHSARRRKADAFTLAEFLVMSTIFMLMIAAIMAAHLYGLKMSTRIGIKLGASDDARQALSKLVSDIRDAERVDICSSGTATSSNLVADGSPQVGSALMIYPGATLNLAQTTNWIRYYYSPDTVNGETNTLMRITSGGGSALLTANYVTNDLPIFKKVDYRGATTSSQGQKPFSIEVTLSFIRLANPQVPIGPSNMFDFYQVLTRVSPRNQ